jgi:hypothetical protein
MKKIISALTLILVVSLAVWSCDKKIESYDPASVLAADQSPVVVAALETVINNPVVAEPSVTTDLSIVSYPPFIATDYFAAAAVTGVVKANATADSSNILCLNGIEITQDQKEKLTAARVAKESCMSANRIALRAIDSTMEAWAKAQKAILIAAARFSLDSVNALYTSGALTLGQKLERNTKIELLRNDLIKALLNQVKEKIAQQKDRAALAGSIKNCEEQYLKTVLTILTRTQYEKWMACFKSKYTI